MNPTTHDNFLETMLGDFLDESSQLMERLNEQLLTLELAVRGEEFDGRCDLALMNEMFRAAHSLKGLSAMLGLSTINNLTHRLENVFDAARNDRLRLTPDIIDLLFRVQDRLLTLIEEVARPSGQDIEIESLTGAIEELLAACGAGRGPSNQADAERALAELRSAPPAAPPAAAAPRAATMCAVAVAETDLFAQIRDESEISAKYLAIFIDEAYLALDDMTETLLGASVAGGGGETHERLLVLSHRIKGSAAAVGLNRIAKLAHHMEDLLQSLRETGQQLTDRTIEAMLKCIDGLRGYTDAVRKGDAPQDGFGALCQELLEAAGLAPCKTPGYTSEGAATPASLAGGPSPRADNSRDELPDGCLEGRVTFEKNFPLVGLKARLVYEKLARAGEVISCQPSAEELPDLDDLEALEFVVRTTQSAEQLEPQLRVTGVATVSVSKQSETAKPAASERQVQAAGEVAATPTSNSPAPAQGATATPPAPKTSKTPKKDDPESGSRPAETLRVDIERLDQLMNLAGQLVINKARFSQIGDGLKNVTISRGTLTFLGQLDELFRRMGDATLRGGDLRSCQAELDAVSAHARRLQTDLEAVRHEFEHFSSARIHVNNLFEAIHQLDRVSDGIQKSVMDTRMVPIGPLFGRFRRVVRDITRQNGKEIELAVHGEKTELDKRMIDELGDPLIHMVRNAADHGVELPEARAAAGKPRCGVITLDAFHRGNSIIIQVADDGKGLDPDRILAKAIEKGIVSAADSARLSRHQIFQLIWEPGFSTAEKVTEISGRGMGMDIVKSKIEELSGTVEVESELGQGTTFTLRLPLTLAILPSLMAEINGEVFAMPVESVVEIVKVTGNDLSTVHGLPTACVRGRLISMVEITELFDWNVAPRRSSSRDADPTLVVIGSDGKEIGLVVDRLLGEEDVVIKSIAENYQNVSGIAGASILGNGRVALILDVVAMLDMASRSAAAQRHFSDPVEASETSATPVCV